MYGNNAVFHAQTKMPFQRNSCKRFSGRCGAVRRKAVGACYGSKRSSKLVHARHSRCFRLARCCADACRSDNIPLIHNLYCQRCCRFEFKLGNAVFGIYYTAVDFCNLSACGFYFNGCIASRNKSIFTDLAVLECC